jgi:ABC-type sugar transport system ATPase subunit
VAVNPYIISLQGVEVSYPKNNNGAGGRNVILNNLRLNIRSGEFLSLVGPTGCGKSTVLRLILGSQFPTRGRVLVDGQPVSGVSRDRGVVFQRYSLFPHLTVEKNLLLGLEFSRSRILGRLFGSSRFCVRSTTVVSCGPAIVSRHGSEGHYLCLPAPGNLSMADNPGTLLSKPEVPRSFTTAWTSWKLCWIEA